MFILTKISDLVTIQPDEFERETYEVLKEKLHAKYANKVIPNIGLGMSIWDLETASDGQVSRGDGAANVNVTFRLIVFKPFHGEIVVGQIAGAGEWGIRVTVQFFDEIIVTPDLLFEGSYWDREGRVWIWENEGDKFYLDRHEWVRVRIEEEHWQDVAPTRPPLVDAETKQLQQQSDEKRSPYRIKASMADSGFGGISWW